MQTVCLGQVLRFRARATGLDRRRRLHPGAWRDAAYGGLQDSAPRSALIALHARLDGVRPASWEEPSLWQIWFRSADYVVPREDFGVFTIGALPRQQEQAAALDATALAVCDTLAGQSLDARKLGSLLPEALCRRGLMPLPRPVLLVRTANVTGRYRIRWDASRVTVIPTDRPEIDPDQARIELARRFLGWHGPATSDQFARWAGVSREDATLTWKVLAPQLISVAMDGQVRHLLAQDEESLRRTEPITGVRLLPAGDPYVAVDRALADATAAGVPPPVGDERGASLTPRLVNSLAGRILMDGTIVGSWGRYQHHVAIHLWQAHRRQRERVLDEAESLAGPIGKPIQVRWLH